MCIRDSNEAARIGGVLAALRHHPLIAETIVIDDGSTDETAKVAETFGVRILRTAGNQGKTRALMHGFGQVATSHVLLLDADLAGLTPDDVTALIAPVASGVAVASISLRGNAPLTWRMIGLDYISGERAMPTVLVSAYLTSLAALPRFGFEVFLNRLLIETGRSVSIVSLPNLISPSKASKRGRIAGLRADVAMMRDIFRTISPFEALHQILALRRAQCL